ncbi:hypothetical protein GQ457_17G006710 [Hibiscus cannabinus]
MVYNPGYRYTNGDFNPVMNSLKYWCLEYRYTCCSTGTHLISMNSADSHESGWQAGVQAMPRGEEEKEEEEDLE